MKEYFRKKLIKNSGRIAVFIFFFVLLVVGLTVFKDYGVHWDEYQNQVFGNKWLSYIENSISQNSLTDPKFLGDPRSETNHHWIHGPAIEIFLAFFQKRILGLHNSRDIIFTRHLCAFLLFYASVWFFYLLCKFHFKSRKVALLGCLFLVISPRIFADSFYNTVDIPFFSFFIISIYTLLRWLDKKTFPRAAVHAFSCAVLTDIRVIGLLVPLFTLIFMISDIVKAPADEERIRMWKATLIYMSLLGITVILFWPLLWVGTFSKLKIVAEVTGIRSQWIPCLYFGKYLKIRDLAWHYVPVWIAISTPLVYSFCFLVGCFVSIKSFFKDSIKYAFSKRNTLLFLLWFFMPTILARGKVCDGWRHLYFVYPAFLIFSITGLISIWEFARSKTKYARRIMSILIVSAVLLNLASVIHFMIKYHPYQNVYFNRLAGRNMEEIKKRFDLDYWGLSYRKALEYILRNDTDESIKICAANLPGMLSANILTDEDRKRLIYVQSPKEAKYFLSNYRWHPDEYPYGKEYFSIKVDGAAIVVVYKLK